MNSNGNKTDANKAENGNLTQKENERNRELVNKQKRTILIVITCLLAFAGLYFAIVQIDFDKLLPKKTPSDTRAPIFFYEERLSEYPEEDEIYMAQDRTVNYSVNGASETLDESGAVARGEYVNLLYQLVEYIKNGNHEGYNACFSPLYYEVASPKGQFTKQKIYAITITEISITEKKDSNGNLYDEHVYTLEYFIRHNNGTLRNDMGSDCSKKQFIVMSNRSGTSLIDNLYTLVYVN